MSATPASINNAPAPPAPPSLRDYAVLIISVAVSLALLALVGYSLILVHGGHLEALGKVEGVGKGTGILGLIGLLVYLAAKIVSPEKKEGAKKSNRKTVVSVFGILITVATAFLSTRTAATLKQQLAEKEALTRQVRDLQISRGELLDFMHSVSRKENLHFIDQNVSDTDWQRIVLTIDQLPAGQRKTTIYGAILLAWQNISLSLQNKGLLNGGVDSANFWKRVFASTGIEVSQRGSERVSEAMKRQFIKVENPQPGDLMFYKGAESTSVGNFVMMYLGPGTDAHGICLGTYDTGKPVEVIDSDYFDNVGKPDLFQGYYRPTYKD